MGANFVSDDLDHHPSRRHGLDFLLQKNIQEQPRIGLRYRLGGDMISELPASIDWGVIETTVVAPLRGASGSTLGPYCSPMPGALWLFWPWPTEAERGVGGIASS